MATSKTPRKVTQLPRAPRVQEFSDSTLVIFNQILASQQINVGAPDFLETTARVVQARTELNAVMKARGLLEPTQD